MCFLFLADVTGLERESHKKNKNSLIAINLGRQKLFVFRPQLRPKLKIIFRFWGLSRTKRRRFRP
jgi:hypothetical protein